MNLYFSDVLASFGDMAHGLGYSVLLTVLSMAFGLAAGVLAYLGKKGGNKIRRRLSCIYIEAIRNTPLLVQLYILYFGITQFGINLSPFTASLIAMTVNAGAYNGEILRAGFEAIPKGLKEAGEALGLSNVQVFLFVLLKPALKNAFPALVNQLVLLFLFSSVTAAISMEELTYVTFNLQSSTARVFEVLFLSGALYYGSSALSVALLRRWEKRLFQW